MTKEMEDDTNISNPRKSLFLDWKNRFVKMTILPKDIYRFNEISITLPMAFFRKLEKNFKFVWKHTHTHTHTQINQMSQSNHEKEKMELEESGSMTSDYTTKLQ